MSRRARREAVSSLAIVLPHPELPRRCSSLLSQSSIASPRTPRSSGCPSPRFQSSWLMTSNSSNRKSTDSWNSSNYDFGEDEADWKPEQTLLLSRTLDALPAHLTPFNGPIPPSNLLDKIARGVTNAKGPNEWPHSLRATRVKLIEISRQRAKDEYSTRYNKQVADENDDIGCYSPDSESFSRKPVGVRRPLYRQSSMDFMNTDDRKLTNNDTITRLSTRLQRTENSLSNNSYHPYTRSRARALTQSLAQTPQNQMHRRSPSPPRAERVPSLINPSTPSSSTLSSLSTSAARPRLSRRSVSSLSSDVSMFSASSIGEELPSSLLPSAVAGVVDPRMQRVRRSESFCGPAYAPASSTSIRDGFPSSGTPPPSRRTFKRAPSYGALAQEVRDKDKEKKASGIYHLEARERINASPCPSSDEEEKVRDNQAKKQKVPGLKSPKRPVVQEKEVTPRKTKKKVTECTDKGSRKTSTISTVSDVRTTDASAGSRPRLRMNLERNPSIFGDELPHLHIPSASGSYQHGSSTQPTVRSPTTPSRRSSTPSTVPTDPQVKAKTLRRVKRLAPGRKISFGSLVPPAGEPLLEEDSEENARLLGSAFQLS